MYPEAIVQRCSVKNVFLEISLHSQENTYASLFFKKRPTTLLKKRLWHRCFPVNFAKFLITPFFTEHLWWLLLCTFIMLTRVMMKNLDNVARSTKTSWVWRLADNLVIVTSCNLKKGDISDSIRKMVTTS